MILRIIVEAQFSLPFPFCAPFCRLSSAAPFCPQAATECQSLFPLADKRETAVAGGRKVVVEGGRLASERPSPCSLARAMREWEVGRGQGLCSMLCLRCRPLRVRDGQVGPTLLCCYLVASCSDALFLGSSFLWPVRKPGRCMGRV